MVFCSTIIPTIGRPSLERAVSSVLEQQVDGAMCEVIVVNDSGRSLPWEKWHDASMVQIIETHRSERCVARNAGVAVAKGLFLHFLDDDDVMLPGSHQAFWRLHKERAEIPWLFGGYQTVDNAGHLVAEFHPDLKGDILAEYVAGESIPFQASLLLADAVRLSDGFDPMFVGVEDRDLGRRLSVTCAVASVTPVVTRIRIGEENSTTNWRTIARSDRRAREKVLETSGIHAQLLSSVDSAYWSGRVARAYLASAAWNARRGRLRRAASRLTPAFELLSGASFRRASWRGLRRMRAS